MEDRGRASTRPGTVIRWIARITGTLFMGVFLSFFIADLVEQGATHVPNDRLPMLFSLFLAFIGLAMAWKWERAGGITALVGLTLYCVFGLQTEVKPAATFLVAGAYALPAILFVIYGLWARRAPVAHKTGAA